MARTYELRKAIQAFLKSKHPRVYYERAPEKEAVFPYLVFDLPNSFDDGAMERFVLDVDGWSQGEDTAELETLMDVVDGDGDKLQSTGLHRKTVMVNGFSFTFYRENRISLRDDDPSIRRRKITYQVRTHEGG